MALGAERMPKTVALVYIEQVIKDIPTDEHDFKIDKVLCGNENSA